MSKQDLSRHQQKIVKRYYEHHETIQTEKLSDLLSELWLAEDDKAKTRMWGKAQVALMRVGLDATRVGNIVAKRDLEGLARLIKDADAGKGAGTTRPAEKPALLPPASPIAQKHKTSGAGATPLDGSAIKALGARSVADQTGGKTIAQMKAEKAEQGGYDSLDESNLKRALKAFRTKLKLHRQDDESRLGGRYTSGGKTSGISAITPPAEFPPPVWDKLVESGRLKRAGGGTLQLP